MYNFAGIGLEEFLNKCDFKIHIADVAVDIDFE
jgi:hypothetical protein